MSLRVRGTTEMFQSCSQVRSNLTGEAGSGRVIPGLLAGQVRPHGSGRVGRRPAIVFVCLDLTRSDPRYLETS